MSFIQIDPESSVKVMRVLVAGACTIPLAIVSWSLSRVFSSLMEALGRNAEVAVKGLTIIIISAVFMETVVLFVLVIALIILFS